MDADEQFRLIDVREPSEFEIARIAGAELKPLGQIMTWAQSLPDQHETIIVYCHHGIRSARACEYLMHMGWTQISNLTGGIDAWSQQVDPAVPRY